MSDENERSVASAGSGSGLPVHKFPQEWSSKTQGMTFFGVPIQELSRDELMAVVGHLADQVEQERKRHRSTVDFLKAASAASR